MRQGLVQAVGISNYGPKQMERIHTYLDKRGVPLGAAQVQYSLLSRGPQQEQIRAVCRDLGVQMIAYSPMALGMLSGEIPHCSCCCTTLIHDLLLHVLHVLKGATGLLLLLFQTLSAIGLAPAYKVLGDPLGQCCHCSANAVSPVA